MTRTDPLRLVGLASVGVVALAALPAGPLPVEVTSAADSGAWWDANGTAAAIGIVRLGALIGCAYVAAIAALYTVADVLRVRWLRRVALFAATPALRRRLAAGALTIAIAATPATAAAQNSASEAPIVLADLGAAAPAEGVDVIVDPIVLTDVGPDPDHVLREPALQMTAPGSLGGYARVDPPDAPDAWLVEAGDHLWAIATHIVETTGETADEASVAAYWTRLVAANASALDGDPDLIHPGQVLSLPPMDQG